MNNMNLRRPDNCGGRMNYNFNQCNMARNPDCGSQAQGRGTNCNTGRNVDCNTGCSTGCGNASCGCNPDCDAGSSLYNDPLNGMATAIGYVPWQQWCKVYDLCKGLNQGTIFPSLDLPFYGCIPRGFSKGQGGAV